MGQGADLGQRPQTDFLPRLVHLLSASLPLSICEYNSPIIMRNDIICHICVRLED